MTSSLGVSGECRLNHVILARPQLIMGEIARWPDKVSIGHGKPPAERPSNKVGSGEMQPAGSRPVGGAPRRGRGNDESEFISDGGPCILRDGGVWIRKDCESRPLSNVE